MIPATIIAIEGPDKSGKFTQSRLLTEKLNELGFKSTLIEVPIKSSVTYKLIYWMLDNGLAKKVPLLFQIIQFLNKLMFQLFVLSFLRWKYSYVVFDRWSLSAVVYGDAEGVKTSINKWMYDRLRKPDLTVVLDGSWYNRSTKDDSYEADHDLQFRVGRNYLVQAMKQKNIKVVSGVGTRDQVHNRILDSIKEYNLF